MKVNNMRKAIIKDNTVINVIEIDDGANWMPPEGTILVNAVSCQAGDLWDGNNFSTPVVLDQSIPNMISDRQFFQGLAMQGLITQEEALGAVKTGTLPGQLELFINQLPENDQFQAKMILSGATQFFRNNYLTEAFGVMAGMSTEQLDNFWVFCSQL